MNPFFYHPDLAEPSMENIWKTQVWFCSGPSNKAEFRARREQPKNRDTLFYWTSRGGSGVGKMGERLNQYFFFSFLFFFLLTVQD